SLDFLVVIANIEAPDLARDDWLVSDQSRRFHPPEGLLAHEKLEFVCGKRKPRTIISSRRNRPRRDLSRRRLPQPDNQLLQQERRFPNTHPMRFHESSLRCTRRNHA